jgi:hypothetical protein
MDITWQGGWLFPGQALFNVNPQDGLEDRLFSYDQNFFLKMQNDGNLVIYDSNGIWGGVGFLDPRHGRLLRYHSVRR